jgi:hypothetical protein
MLADEKTAESLSVHASQPGRADDTQSAPIGELIPVASPSGRAGRAASIGRHAPKSSARADTHLTATDQRARQPRETSSGRAPAPVCRIIAKLAFAPTRRGRLQIGGASRRRLMVETRVLARSVASQPAASQSASQPTTPTERVGQISARAVRLRCVCYPLGVASCRCALVAVINARAATKGAWRCRPSESVKRIF